MLLDITAPIIPFKGFGEIRLYSTRDQLKELLSSDDVKVKLMNENWIRYDIQNSVELFFHLKNNKLFRITTLDNYKGKLFEKIGVGSTEEEMLESIKNRAKLEVLNYSIKQNGDIDNANFGLRNINTF